MEQEKTGYIYVVQMEGHDLYKVGRSVNVPRRMSEFGVQLPFKFTLHFALRVPDARQREEMLHRDLSQYRRNGEWFNLKPQHVNWVKCHLLAVQAHHKIAQIQARFASEDLYVTRLERYGKLFIRLSVRLERRMLNSHHAGISIIRAFENEESEVNEHILDAEIIG